MGKKGQGEGGPTTTSSPPKNPPLIKIVQN